MHALTLFTRCLVVAEVLAAVAGFVTWHKWKHSYLKWFPLYLAVIVLLETGYHVFSYFKQHEHASWMYEVAIPVEIIFINWFFYKTLNEKNRKLIIAGVIMYVLVMVLEKTLLSSVTYYFQSLAYTVGNLFILIYLILFFIQLVKSEKILAFNELTSFWIGCGLLVFYLGSFPFYGLYNELAKNINIFMPIAWVATFLNYCMYLLFIIGFIWGKPH